MAQESSNKLSTTELLKLNLSDFLEEVKQDYLSDKYEECLVVGSQILYTEFENYLSRITNNFEDAESIINDIYIWNRVLLLESNNRACDLPIISTIYSILFDKVELKFYNDTFENLKKDSNYKSVFIEAILNNTSTQSGGSILINEYRLKGYNRAVENFNSLKQATKDKNENTDKPQRIIDSERLKDYFNSTFKGMGTTFIGFRHLWLSLCC